MTSVNQNLNQDLTQAIIKGDTTTVAELLTQGADADTVVLFSTRTEKNGLLSPLIVPSESVRCSNG